MFKWFTWLKNHKKDYIKFLKKNGIEVTQIEKDDDCYSAVFGLTTGKQILLDFCLENDKKIKIADVELGGTKKNKVIVVYYKQ